MVPTVEHVMLPGPEVCLLPIFNEPRYSAELRDLIYTASDSLTL